MEGLKITGEHQRLLADWQAFINAVAPLSEKQFKEQLGGKWSVANVMQHLYLSARPVVRLMTGSRDILLQWGKPDTASRAYDEIAAAYQKRLAIGAKAPATMSPRPEDMQVEKQIIVERFTAIYQTLIEAINNWSEQELDAYVIPHPALGKITVREMLYFISIHTEHHLRLILKA